MRILSYFILKKVLNCRFANWLLKKKIPRLQKTGSNLYIFCAMDVREALLPCHSWNYPCNAIVATFGIMKYAPFDSFYLDIIVTLCLAWICSVCVLVQKYPPWMKDVWRKETFFSCSHCRSTELLQFLPRAPVGWEKRKVITKLLVWCMMYIYSADIFEMMCVKLCHVANLPA